jgi:membrane associated rhomboid family serine protease
MFPYSCDAPLYYLPFATGTIIALNVLAFFGAVTGEIVVDDGWLLQWGAGMHPLQWLTSRFMHASSGHLLGNMFFLWAFGLVVEGKLGWWRFVCCYLSIALGQAAIEQTAMLGYSGPMVGSLGASAAIFGVMAMACIWAPVNELSVLLLLGWIPITFEVTVGVFAAFFGGMDIVWTMLLGSGAASSIMHLMGGAMGAALGIVLLKRGVVNCEDWDLFSVWSGDYGKWAKEKREAAADAPVNTAARVEQKAADARRKLDAYLEIDQPDQALMVYRRAVDMKTPLMLDRAALLRLITGLHKRQQWADSSPLMAELIDRFPDDSQLVRLKLAQICLVELEKPLRALDLLAGLNDAKLPAPQEQLARKLAAAAQRQVAQGELEVDDATW